MNFLPFFFPFPCCFLAWQRFHCAAYRQGRGRVLTWPKYDESLHCAGCSEGWILPFGMRFSDSKATAKLLRKESHDKWVSSALGTEGKVILRRAPWLCQPWLLWILGDSLGSTLILVSSFSFGFEAQPDVFHSPLGPGEWSTCYLYILCLPSRIVWWEEHGFGSHTEPSCYLTFVSLSNIIC